MAVPDIAGQDAAAGTGTDRFQMHQHRRGAQRHRRCRLFYLPLDPARRRIVGLLVGVGDPRTGIGTTTPVDRTGEGTCLGDVEVAGFWRLMAQRHIGFASREVCRLSRVHQFQSDA